MKIKKFLSVMLTVLTLLSISTVALAADSNSSSQNSELYLETSDTESNPGTAEPNGLKYVYKTENLPKQTKTVSGYASNQPSGGIYLSNPSDGICYTYAGGATVTAGVSVSLPKPYNYISFSVSIGAAKGNAATGAVATLGNKKPGYYRLRISKDYTVSPYVVYRKRSGAQYTKWEIDHTGCTVSTYKNAKATLVLVK